MKKINRETQPFLVRGFRASISLGKLFLNLLKREITLKQFILDIRFRFIAQSKMLNDDFDWDRYPIYYKEELKSVSRVNTLLIRNKNFEFVNGRLIKCDPNARDLHPSHEVLYNTVLGLHPSSVLEVGCGGGDHLANIHEMDSTIRLFGVDRSDAQLVTFSERHPGLVCETSVSDVTETECKTYEVDLVFTQAVLMHISEKDERFRKALNTVFNSAVNYVVLIENWSQHDFLAEIEFIQATNPEWSKSFIYIAESRKDDFTSALVVSKKELLGLIKLNSYEQLLAGRKLLVH